MKRPLVLVVDDVRDNREMYMEYLSFAGFRTIGAADSENAIELARKQHPAVILMDLALPGIGGWEATRILKSDPATRTILVIAVSGHAEEPFRQRAHEVGCDFFVAKPVLPSELAAHVIRLLDGRTARGQSG